MFKYVYNPDVHIRVVFSSDKKVEVKPGMKHRSEKYRNIYSLVFAWQTLCSCLFLCLFVCMFVCLFVHMQVQAMQLGFGVQSRLWHSSVLPRIAAALLWHLLYSVT